MCLCILVWANVYLMTSLSADSHPNFSFVCFLSLPIFVFVSYKLFFLVFTRNVWSLRLLLCGKHSALSGQLEAGGTAMLLPQYLDELSSGMTASSRVKVESAGVGWRVRGCGGGWGAVVLFHRVIVWRRQLSSHDRHPNNSCVLLDAWPAFVRRNSPHATILQLTLLTPYSK